MGTRGHQKGYDAIKKPMVISLISTMEHNQYHLNDPKLAGKKGIDLYKIASGERLQRKSDGCLRGF